MSSVFGREIYVPDVERAAAAGRPSVLVALSVKDGVEFLPAAIESVLAQTGVELTLEVYDNGSSDGSQEVAGRYSEEGLRLIQNPPGLNYFGSMNRAIAGCTAELFVPWACDDVMLPGNLALKAAALREHPQAGFAWSASLIVDEHDRVHDFYPAVSDVARLPAWSPAPTFFPFLVPVGQVVMSSVMARPAALRAVGGFDARSVLVADWLCWMKLAMRFGVVTLPYALIQYRQHPACGSVAAKRGGYAEQEPAVLREAFRDPCFLARWRPQADRWTAALIAHTAHGLLQNQLLRWRDGFPAYALAVDALRFLPGDAQLRRYASDLLGLAGLPTPPFPCAVVARPELTRAALADMVEHFRSLHAGGIAGRLIVSVPEQAMYRAPDLVRRALAGGAPATVNLVPGPLEALLRPGMALIAPFGSPQLAEAERHGVPGLAYRVPDCFARPRDPDRWETLDGPRASVA